MPSRSWAARLPRVYDLVMAPVNALGMSALRARLYDGLPRSGAGLEIGTGSGAAAHALRERATPVGIDISHAMLLRARDREVRRRPLLAADVHALPFASGSFDWAVASLVFCEVSDPLRGLRELHRVLRRGGALHLLEHVEPRGAILRTGARALTRMTGPLFGEHFDRRTHETVAAAGFVVERADWRVNGGVVLMVARRDEREEP